MRVGLSVHAVSRSTIRHYRLLGEWNRSVRVLGNFLLIFPSGRFIFSTLESKQLPISSFEFIRLECLKGEVNRDNCPVCQKSERTHEFSFSIFSFTEFRGDLTTCQSSLAPNEYTSFSTSLCTECQGFLISEPRMTSGIMGKTYSVD